MQNSPAGQTSNSNFSATGNSLITPEAKTAETVWFFVVGRRQKESPVFHTIGDLEPHLRQLKAAKAAGELTRIPTASELRSWRRFIQGAGNVDPMLILEEWRAARAQQGKSTKRRLVAEAVEAYLTDQQRRQLNGTISVDSLRQRKRKLSMFNDTFASFALDEITAVQIEDWIQSLEEVSAVGTFNDYRKRIIGFYT